MTTSSTERFDVHQAIANQIIAAIEAGTGKLQMPWHRSGANIMRPVNVASGNAYRGVNTVALWAAADALAISTAFGAPTASGRIAAHRSEWARNPLWSSSTVNSRATMPVTRPATMIAVAAAWRARRACSTSRRSMAMSHPNHRPTTIGLIRLRQPRPSHRQRGADYALSINRFK